MQISIIVPTYNEEETIGGLLENLHELGAGEVIVSDGGSTDRTTEIAGRHARVLHATGGRALQMNAGADASIGDVLWFLHADVRLGPGALRAVRNAIQDPAVVGGNLDIRYEGNGWAADLFTCINRWRRRWGILYGDSGIFCRRAVFYTLGGYQPWPILEDYDFARRLWKSGTVALLEEPIWVSARRWRSSGLIPTLWSWFVIQTLYYAGVSPHRLARMYQKIR